VYCLLHRFNEFRQPNLLTVLQNFCVIYIPQSAVQDLLTNSLNCRFSVVDSLFRVHVQCTYRPSLIIRRTKTN